MATHQIVPYIFKDQPVRTVDLGGEPWFVGKDVCRVLDIRDHGQAIDRLEADERGGCIVPTPGGSQTVAVISEPGVYRLVFTSRKAEAEEFKRWLAHEVLPQIRKTGRFAPAEPSPIDGFDQIAVETLRAKLDLVREYRRARGTAASAAMWTYLGLPEPTARGGQATMAQSGARCLAQLLDGLDIEGRRFGALLEKALSDGDFYEEMDLGVAGMRIVEDGAGVVFANGHFALSKAFEGTVWADGRWSPALKRLPGARAWHAQRFGGVTCRGVFVPAEVVLDAAIASDPR